LDDVIKPRQPPTLVTGPNTADHLTVVRALARVMDTAFHIPGTNLRVGLDSIIGAVVGGLIVGIVENLAAGYLDPFVGGGTKDFAPYVLMIAVLMVRPEGIFGRRRIERV
jgi:hypothetical protein